MTITIYHNPRCSRSRQTLQLLRDRGHEPRVIEYLKEPLTEAELTDILAMLGKSPGDIIRKGEAAYKDLELADTFLSDAALISAMAATPILIERPIVINGNKTAVGRPPESVLDIL